ncbi:hypothetical protein [Sanguibacter sp. HDW7]|uniref:hypothetical protein n=1 Tax=Sanguibacter sp. HDW7 TaxID=2714931 RepID=UPI00140993BC|nr:hypothetical protein [Sanguibacter sp. HDW7]QIK83001.1 hypothetical protein G7063_04685 [Sanguibacter sp. HDW7]
MTDPITPDERATMRECAERLYSYGGEEQVLAEGTIRLLDALVTAEDAREGAIRALDEHRCDEQAERGYSRAMRAEAEVERLRQSLDKASADEETLDDFVSSAVRWQRRALSAEARAERLSEKVAGLSKSLSDELRTTAPSEQGQDTVAALVLAHAVDWTAPGDQIRCRCGIADESTVGHAVHVAEQVAAVVRQHAPVRPDRETLSAALNGLTREQWDERWEAPERAFLRDRVSEKVDAVLAEWPGESRAQVQAEALRAFADTRGVNVGDEDDEWWRGYRQAQRECLHDASARADRLAAEGGPTP